MIKKIWGVLTQILCHRNDLVYIIKPFFANLKNENINDQKYLPLLETFPKYQLEALYQNGIISRNEFDEIQLNYEKKLKKFIFMHDNIKFHDPINYYNDESVEEIISADTINELQELIQEKDIKNFSLLTRPFKEVKTMHIPLIQYCIMKNAIKCFKYLLVNGFDDPHKCMEVHYMFQKQHLRKINNQKYKWDCMATAIYYGNKEVIKILEDKQIEKENPATIEAAILSYRNTIAKALIDEMTENNNNNDNNDNDNNNNNENNDNKDKNFLNVPLFASVISNNIKGGELLIKKGANINVNDINYQNMILLLIFNHRNKLQIIKHYLIMQQRIIQKRC